MTDEMCHLVVDANDVIHIKLVRTREDLENDKLTFKPEMSHQVFGDNESIFGYKDLQINFLYSAGSLLTYLGIDYTEKIEPSKSEGLEADDVEELLKKVVPPGYLTNLDRFVAALEKDSKFTPHGKLIYSFTITPSEGNDKRIFEVYYNDVTNPAFLDYHARFQTFIMWFIDAASFIDVDDERWTFFTVFEKYQTAEGSAQYASVGYATVVRYYAYPRHVRPRISQVLVLPPYQRMGICAHILRAIYAHYTALPEVRDITVEDPAEHFTRIRDYVDAKNCSTLPSFQPDKLFQGFTTEMAQQACKKFKINKLQARRVYEILRLQATNTSDKTAYVKFRLYVKNRLNVPHQRRELDMKKLKKVLSPDEYKTTVIIPSTSETHERLKKEFSSLEQEYRRVIERLERD